MWILLIFVPQQFNLVLVTISLWYLFDKHFTMQDVSWIAFKMLNTFTAVLDIHLLWNTFILFLPVDYTSLINMTMQINNFVLNANKLAQLYYHSYRTAFSRYFATAICLGDNDWVPKQVLFVKIRIVIKQWSSGIGDAYRKWLLWFVRGMKS